MTIADLFKELHDTAKERIKNPIIGAFICSFLVCNWQAFFILFFSEMSIEERIEFANTKWKIIWPIILSLVYTLVVPLIMIGMDYALMPMKRKRISNIYQNKGFTTDKKIKHAEKEYQLKNAESGNKDREELMQKIKSLEETNSQLITSHKNRTDQLNSSLQEASNSLEKANKDLSEALKEIKKLETEKQEMMSSKRNISQKLYNNLSINEQQFFKAMVSQGGEFQSQNISPSIIDSFKKKGLIEETQNGLNLTELGRSVWVETLFVS